jgi:hypothetical protein
MTCVPPGEIVSAILLLSLLLLYFLPLGVLNSSSGMSTDSSICKSESAAASGAPSASAVATPDEPYGGLASDLLGAAAAA